METRRALGVIASLIAASLVLALLAFPYLPPQVPAGWGFRGEAVSWQPRGLFVWIGPGLQALHGLLAVLLPKCARRFAEVEAFQRTYMLLVVFVQAAITTVFVLILVGSIFPGFPLSRSIFAVVSLLIAICGNYLGKVQTNLYFGVRTPWTLTDRRVWDATNRVAGKLTLFSGLCGFVLSWFAPLWFVTAVLIASMAAPAVYSIFAYQRQSEGGPPGRGGDSTS